jgi:hypothetical protein
LRGDGVIADLATLIEYLAEIDGLERIATRRRTRRK